MGPGVRLAWRTVQALVWAAGLACVWLLWFRPEIGLHALWNVLIPAAPALLAFAPGLWRNICPLGTMGLLPRHAGVSARRRLSRRAQAALALGGVLLLFALVPLRHVSFNTDGRTSAIVLVALGAAAAGLGLAVEWKSGWCAGLCPVRPVERLYGAFPSILVANAHCDGCHRCVAVCPDSTVERPRRRETLADQAVQALMAGAFPGFVWGWFQVPDGLGWSSAVAAYGWPMGGAAATLALWVGARLALPARHHGWIVRVAAFTAIATYYCYRLPALIGAGPFPGDGMLVDLRGLTPAWLPWALRAATTALFAWWFLRPDAVRRPWVIRPGYSVPERGDTPTQAVSRVVAV